MYIIIQSIFCSRFFGDNNAKTQYAVKAAKRKNLITLTSLLQSAAIV